MGRELVMIFSTATLLALFFYIFHDFLNEKIAGVAPHLRQAMSRGFLSILLVLLGPVLAGQLKNLWQSEMGWNAFALRAGEDPRVLRSFRCLQTLWLLALSYGFFYLVLLPRFETGSTSLFWLWQSLGLILGAVRLRWFSDQDPAAKNQLKPILKSELQSRSQTLLLWRWHQLSRRHRLARLCLGLGIALQIANFSLLASGWPFFISILGAMLSSLLFASAVAFQLEEDMRSVWFERQLGCSHQEFVAVYQKLCFGLGGALALIAFVPCLIFSRSYPLAETWKIIPIAALFPSLLPSVMFQLAPERPLLQILVTALLGLFLGTAIYAHALSLVLVPFLIYYAKNYQQNNFYRT